MQNLKHTKSKVKKLAKSIAKDTSSIGENESTVQRLEEDTVRFAAEIEKMQTKLVDEEKTLESIKEECKVRTYTHSTHRENQSLFRCWRALFRRMRQHLAHSTVPQRSHL